MSLVVLQLCAWPLILAFSPQCEEKGRPRKLSYLPTRMVLR